MLSVQPNVARKCVWRRSLNQMRRIDACVVKIKLQFSAHYLTFMSLFLDVTRDALSANLSSCHLFQFLTSHNVVENDACLFLMCVIVVFVAYHRSKRFDNSFSYSMTIFFNILL